MNVGLCMVIKNEASNLQDCLGPIVDLFDNVVIIDTGSTDGSQEILTQELGIKPLERRLQAAHCFSKHLFANEGLSLLKTEWAFILDADERIDPKELLLVKDSLDDPEVDGYFCEWITHKNDDVIEDYKLCLFRSGARKSGFIHSNAQYEFRRQNLHAVWCPALSLHHFPDRGMEVQKLNDYLARLDCAMNKDPDWQRYNWFYGYMMFVQDRFSEAIEPLSSAGNSQSKIFPVESLNARVVLAEILARTRQQDELIAVLEKGIRFHDEVQDDFEVKINFRLRPWLNDALSNARMGRLDTIRAYPFAY